MVSETKIDDTDTIFNGETQFLMEGFSTTYRLDWRAKGEGILLYIRQDTPSKYILKITVNESLRDFLWS